MALLKIRPFAAGPSAAYVWTLVAAFLLAVSGSSIKNSIASFVVQVTYAPFYSLNNGIKRINSVSQKNQLLKAQVAELTAENNRLAAAERENADLRDKLDFKKRSKLTVIPAEVVGSPAVPIRGTVWISAGPGKDLDTGSAVITPDGLVGSVSGLSGELAVVRSLWDRDCRVAAIDRRSRAAGIIQWESGPYLTFRYVPIDGDVDIRDTIVSSGWGERYPEGLPIGEVREVTVDSTAFFLSIIVRPFVRFETLEEVFVIRQLRMGQSAEAGE